MGRLRHCFPRSWDAISLSISADSTGSTDSTGMWAISCWSAQRSVVLENLINFRLSVFLYSVGADVTFYNVIMGVQVLSSYLIPEDLRRTHKLS